MATAAFSDDSIDQAQRLSLSSPLTSSVDELERSHADIEIDHTSSASPPQSALEYFIASFFQEKNIRWMLVIGATIVFGSSLMLVTREWSEWPPEVQYLTILGYTAAIFGFAETGRKRLGLLATARVLHFLTLLLLPISFLSLGWLTSQSIFDTPLATLRAVALLIPASLLTWFASTRILDNWLRGRQTTFVVSYQVLCMAGALPVIENPWLAAITTALLWMVMTAGIIKVNRHVFWMLEEYRQPRIFGFLPIGLLGLLFIMLMATKARAVPPEWIGLGCVAIAATVLVTVQSLANVYRQRTGDLVRPLPWNITVPMLVGIILTALGVLLSFYGFSYSGTSTRAVVPTAMLAAGLMMIVAKETRHSGFVWSALILATITYQSAPTLFADLVTQCKAHAAHALAEEKLPFAFYGLTYLPLLMSMAVGFRYFADRKQSFVSQPIKQLATFLAFVLFALSFTHSKALCPVSFVNIFLYMLFAVTFRDRRYMIPSLLSVVLTAATWISFGNSMNWFELSPIYAVTSLASLACAFVSTRFPDRIIQRLTNVLRVESQGASANDSRTVFDNMSWHLGLFLSTALGCGATGFLITNLGIAWDTPLLVTYVTILLSICLSTIATRHYLCGIGFWIFAAVGASTWVIGAHFLEIELLSGLTLVTTTISLLVSFGIKTVYKYESLRITLRMLRQKIGVDSSTGLIRRSQADPQSNISQSLLAFVIPLGDLSFILALCLTACFHLPMLILANVMIEAVLTPFSTSMAMLWMMVLGLGFRNVVACVATFTMLPLWTTAILCTVFPDSISYTMFPLIWSLVAGATLVVVDRFPTENLRPAKFIGIGWLAAIVIFSFFHLDLSIRASGIVGLAFLGFVLRRRSNRLDTSSLAILGNLQILLLIAFLGGMRGWTSDLMNNLLVSDALPLAIPTIGVSVLFFDRRWSKLDPIASRAWSCILRTAMLIGVSACFVDLNLKSSHILPVFLGIAIASIAELCEAGRRQWEGHVWSGFAALGLSVAWLAHCNVITFGAGVSQFVLLAISIATLAFGERLRCDSRFSIFVRPLQVISQALPAMVTVAALIKELIGLPAIWSGSNTLALLSAAGIYFHHGLVTKHRGYHVAAAAIVNITFALLWNSLGQYDLQLYLVPLGFSIIGVVELLRKEIPISSHDPIRYMGALTILVSPVFQILNGSWWHLFSLMVLSVLVILFAIGLRVRVLVYTGTAFLMADMVAMVVRTTIDHPNFLWVGGLGIGVAVITLAAICERHREQLLARIRYLSTELATWN